MTIYCHICHNAVDLPSQGPYSTTTSTKLTDFDTYQCLDAKCWKSISKQVKSKPKTEQLRQRRQWADKTEAIRWQRLIDGGSPMNLNEAKIYTKSLISVTTAQQAGDSSQEAQAATTNNNSITSNPSRPRPLTKATKRATEGFNLDSFQGIREKADGWAEWEDEDGEKIRGRERERLRRKFLAKQERRRRAAGGSGEPGSAYPDLPESQQPASLSNSSNDDDYDDGDDSDDDDESTKRQPRLPWWTGEDSNSSDDDDDDDDDYCDIYHPKIRIIRLNKPDRKDGDCKGKRSASPEPSSSPTATTKKVVRGKQLGKTERAIIKMVTGVRI